MNRNTERILVATRNAYEKLSAWVAGLTFWRFVLFSLLVLIAASIFGRILFPDPAQPATTVQIDHSAETKPDVPAPPVPPKASTDTGGTAKLCKDEIEVGWTGIRVRETCNKGDAGPADTIDETLADIDKNDDSPRHPGARLLKDWVMAGLAVLWIMWFIGRARKKAEARADRAEAVAEKEGLERQVAEARLQALQAQVEPHFLFNTLGAVEHLIETDPPRAAEMQRHLIAFLRGAMPRMRGERVTLGDEIELCRNYLAIMKIRMEDRLDYSIDLPAELAGASFPPMMLQSVVENAIKHGLEPKAEGGSVVISVRAAAGRLRVAVADSGLGFGNAGTAGTGIGLNNIRERLAGLFGDKAALVIQPNAPTGAQVVIEIPHDGSDGNHC